jgi:hypothetical protein
MDAHPLFDQTEKLTFCSRLSATLCVGRSGSALLLIPRILQLVEVTAALRSQYLTEFRLSYNHIYTSIYRIYWCTR